MEVRRKSALPKRAGTSKVKTEVKTGTDSKKIGRRHLSSALTIECFNFTGQTIKTLNHLGLCTIHPANTTAPDERAFIGCFVIRRRCEVSDDTQITEMYDSVRGTNRASAPMEDFINDLLIDINHRARDSLSRRDSTVYYSVSATSIAENNGNIYIPDLDLVVISERCNQEIVHPNSPKALDLHMQQMYDAAHTYSIEINDPINGDKPFYVNINDKVFEIIPTKNEYLGEEVRITFKAPHKQAETIYLGVIDDAELEKIGLFRKYADADKYREKLEVLQQQLNLENTMAKAKLENTKATTTEAGLEAKLNVELRTLEAKMQEMTQKQELVNAQYIKDLEKIEREKEEARRELVYEREKAEMSLRQLKMKDYYEDRSYERKDSSEIVKFLPLMVGGALALFSIMK